MSPPATLEFQPDLWATEAPAVDRGFSGLERHQLQGGAWIDHQPGWLAGADGLFASLVDTLSWSCRRVRMYDRQVDEPRLTAQVPGADYERHPPLRAVVDALVHRYGEPRWPVCWANLYRDGADSVAWHGDRVGRDRWDALVAIVSLGQRRPLLLRPTGGGPSRRFDLGHGDLFVMGGTCQRTWEHCVPKRSAAGARMSLTFRPWDPQVGDTVLRHVPAHRGRTHQRQG